MGIKILFHSYGNGKHCNDGFAAAYAAWKYFGEQAEYIPCVYSKPAPEIENYDEVYLVDFSYPRDVLLAMEAKCNHQLVVLDHHKTAQEDLLGLHFAKFNMHKSGAELTWEYFHPNKPTPNLIKYVGDRDLWKKQLPHTEEVHRALSSFPQDFYVWNELANLGNYSEFMRHIGEPIYKKELENIKSLICSAHEKQLLGYTVWCTNTDNYNLVSDTLNKICRDMNTLFAVNYRINLDGKMKFEFRSVGDFDVSQIAKQLGGGGHLNAAGAVVDLGDERIVEFVRNYK